VKAFVAVAVLVLCASVAPANAQARPTAPAPSTFRVAINATTLAGLPRRTISATDEGGHTSSYTGVSLDELLVRAGAPHGDPVRGKAMLSYVVVGASDNYHVLFTLPELDASFSDRVVLIADTRDGAPLPTAVGPYRLIVPFDKREARWVRSVTDVELDNAPLP